MINVGSVGQPRDGDPRACYVILDDGRPAGSNTAPLGEPYATVEFPPPRPDDSDIFDPETAERLPAIAARPLAAPSGPVRVTFRRLPYDHEATIQKIYAISELEPFLGDRLRQGR
jgi:diadenosine tetraphosphatase ApaH/serine/threonine PP2A family protein phosphatase